MTHFESVIWHMASMCLLSICNGVVNSECEQIALPPQKQFLDCHGRQRGCFPQQQGMPRCKLYLWSPFKGRRFVLAHRATVSENPLSNKLFCSAVLLGRGRGICCRCAMRAAGWSCVSLPPVRTSPGNASRTHTCSMQYCDVQSRMNCSTL